MKILIAVPTYGQNDSRFTQTAFLLSKIHGTNLAMCPRSMPDKARNGIVEQALKTAPDIDFFFFLDDDTVISNPEILVHLAQTAEERNLDVLAPIAYKRNPPYHPCIFRHRKGPYYDSIDCVEKDADPVFEVDAVHFAATIVRPSVFEKVPKPWFEFLTIEGAPVGEDIVFCRKLKAAGVKLYADFGVEVGHIATPTVVTGDISRAYREKSQGTSEKILTPKSRIIIPP